MNNASANLGFLDGRAFKVLMRMASVALDTPNDKGQPPNLYFGGWEFLVPALGFKLPADVPDEHPDCATIHRRRKKLMSLVSAAITSIEKPCLDPTDSKRHRRIHAADQGGQRVDLITRRTDPRSRTRQVIELHPDAWSTARLWIPVKGYLEDPKRGNQLVPQEGVYRFPEKGGPRRTQEGIEDLPQDAITHPCASSSDRERDHDDIQIEIGTSEESLGRSVEARGHR